MTLAAIGIHDGAGPAIRATSQGTGNGTKGGSMGKLLQIRVSAWTYSEDEVRKTWPALWKLVWGEGGDAVPRKGVVELAQAVFDAVRAGLIPKEQREVLRDKADKAEELRFKFEDALAARQPKEADTISYELEDCLDALEDIAGKF